MEQFSKVIKLLAKPNMLSPFYPAATLDPLTLLLPTDPTLY